jgi:low temperature requirement protein LtrA
MVSVAGMIVAAVGDERVIAHPVEPAGITTNLLLFGGPALFLGAQTWHAATLLKDLRRSRLVALCALIAGGVATPVIPAYLAAVVAAVIVVALAAFESRRRAGGLPAQPLPSSS